MSIAAVMGFVTEQEAAKIVILVSPAMRLIWKNKNVGTYKKLAGVWNGILGIHLVPVTMALKLKAGRVKMEIPQFQLAVIR